MTSTPPVILWFRRDLRLGDNPALQAALATKRAIIPVFIRDPIVDAMGACPRWRLGLSVEALARDIEALGSKLILRSGKAEDVLRDLIKETGATDLFYCRDYTPETIARDTAVKAGLKAENVTVESYNGLLLFEPWTVETLAGGPYRVYSPFWRAVRDRPVPELIAAPSQLSAVDPDISSDGLADWKLGADMQRGASVVGRFVSVGEASANLRLSTFVAEKAGPYKADRDRMDLDATSGLSENLAYGEISPRTIWHAGQQALQTGAPGAEHFLKELVWREFAYHLLFHTPEILERNWRPAWDAFPWRGESEDAERWRRGLTGEPIVDAAMRELYVTGRMHNRARMIVASYLTKHLMTDWRIGRDWFADCLTDWDPASNALGWQWVAGCGPDAAPYFRIFNPATQAEKFDALGAYRERFLPSSGSLSDGAAAFYDAVPQSWRMSPSDPAPSPLISLPDGRARALAAYSAFNADPAA